MHKAEIIVGLDSDVNSAFCNSIIEKQNLQNYISTKNEDISQLIAYDKCVICENACANKKWIQEFISISTLSYHISTSVILTTNNILPCDYSYYNYGVLKRRSINFNFNPEMLQLKRNLLVEIKWLFKESDEFVLYYYDKMRNKFFTLLYKTGRNGFKRIRLSRRIYQLTKYDLNTIAWLIKNFS